MIFTIAGKELKTLFASPLAWLVLTVVQLIVAYAFLRRLDDFLQVQPQLIQMASPPGVTEFVAAPVFATAAAVFLFAVPLLAMRLIAEERRNQTLVLLMSAPVSMTEIVLGKFLGLLAFLALIIALVVADAALARARHAARLRPAGELRWRARAPFRVLRRGEPVRVVASPCTRWRPRSAPSPPSLGMLLVGDVAADGLKARGWSVAASLAQVLSPIRNFEPFGRGMLDTYAIACSPAPDRCLPGARGPPARRAAAARLMEINAKRRWQLAAHDWLFAVLVIALAALLAWVAREYRLEHDLTRTHRNTLSARHARRAQAARRPGHGDRLRDGAAMRAATTCTGRSSSSCVPTSGPSRTSRSRSSIPREQPKARRGRRRAVAGRVRRSSTRAAPSTCTEFNEQAFANALMRLARGSERLVMWLEGHGERRLDGVANHDLGEFGRQLQQKGFRMNSVNLGLAQEVPANAALLMIASPQADLQPAEVEKIQRYLAGGGNLLWLIDPEPLRGLQPVAELLGLVLTPGTVVDPALAPRSGPPVYALGAAQATAASRHRARLSLNTLFPFARQIGAVESDDWRSVAARAGGAARLGRGRQAGRQHHLRQEPRLTRARSTSPPRSNAWWATGSSASSSSAMPAFLSNTFSATAATSNSASTW